jgi:hypothetical protein
MAIQDDIEKCLELTHCQHDEVYFTEEIVMNNTQFSELAFELLRIHLGKHHVILDVEALRAADQDGLVVFRGVLPELTDVGIDAVNRMIVGLSEGMVVR